MKLLTLAVAVQIAPVAALIIVALSVLSDAAQGTLRWG